MKHALRCRHDGNQPRTLQWGAGVRALLSALIMPFACAGDLASLVDSFGDAADALGFPHYVISRISRTRSASPPGTTLEMICARYPDPWVQHYQQRGYAAIDPVHRAAFTHALPYRWLDIPDLSQIERRVLDEAHEAGLPGGISIPIHDPGGSILLVNLSGPSTAVSDAVNPRLAYVISTQFHFELERLTRYQSLSTSQHLSPRQRECLTWVARGKSSWAIGKILGISHHTVDFHIAEAMKILNVSSRTAAAVNAMVQGLIRL
jgi:LuxR family quorum-sensing system transcriptional regulator CciR